MPSRSTSVSSRSPVPVPDKPVSAEFTDYRNAINPFHSNHLESRTFPFASTFYAYVLKARFPPTTGFQPRELRRNHERCMYGISVGSHPRHVGSDCRLGGCRVH